MSLINKMLADLDARAEQSRGKARSRPILEGLRAVTMETQEYFSGFWFAGIMLFMVIAAASAMVWYQLYGDSGDSITVSQPSAGHEVLIGIEDQAIEQTKLASLDEMPDSTIPSFTNRDDSEATSADQGSAEDGAQQSQSAEALEGAALKQNSIADSVSDPGQVNHAAKTIVDADQSAPVIHAPAKPVVTDFSQGMTNLDPADQDGAKPEKVLRPLSPAESAEDLFRNALNALRARQTEIAEEKLKRALEIFPQHIAARESLAELLLQQGHWYEAQQVLHNGVSIAPEHYRFVFLLARVYVEQGNDLQALALLESNRGHGATDADFIGLLATLYQRSGRHDKAEESFMQALSLRPDEGRWWLGLGISCEALQKWSQARDAYVRVRGAHLNRQLVDYADQRLAVVMQHLG